MSVSVSKKHITLEASNQPTLKFHVGKKERETSTFRALIGSRYISRSNIVLIMLEFVVITGVIASVYLSFFHTPAEVTTESVYPSFVNPSDVVLHTMQSHNGRYTATFEPSSGVIRITDKQRYFDHAHTFGSWLNQYYFKYQKDGNFVIYDQWNNDYDYRVCWASRTDGKVEGYTLRLTNDGRLCIFEHDVCVRPIMRY